MNRSRRLRDAALALTTGAALMVLAGCERDAPVAPPAPQTAPAPQAGAAPAAGAPAGASTGASAGSSTEAPVPGPTGTVYPVPRADGAARSAPPQHADDTPANAPGDLTAEEERSQMPMAGQGHNYSGDARKAGQTEATPTSAETTPAPTDAKK